MMRVLRSLWTIISLLVLGACGGEYKSQKFEMGSSDISFEASFTPDLFLSGFIKDRKLPVEVSEETIEDDSPSGTNEIASAIEVVKEVLQSDHRVGDCVDFSKCLAQVERNLAHKTKAAGSSKSDSDSGRLLEKITNFQFVYREIVRRAKPIIGLEFSGEGQIISRSLVYFPLRDSLITKEVVDRVRSSSIVNNQENLLSSILLVAKVGTSFGLLLIQEYPPGTPAPEELVDRVGSGVPFMSEAPAVVDEDQNVHLSLLVGDRSDEKLVVSVESGNTKGKLISHVEINL